MERLSQNWLTEGLVDFEYKKYVLLAYLKNVRENFNGKRLYPFLADLLFHYKNLLELKENKKLLYENFPKTITKADFEKLQLVYKEIVNDDKVMQEIEDIISFSLPKLESHVQEGKVIFDDIEGQLTISPIGVSPLDQQAGYLFIHVHNEPETKIFEYQVTIFESADERFRGLHTNYVESAKKTFANTFESMKIELIKKYRNMPNPATFLIDSKSSFPFNETLLPIAKRMLIKTISNPAI